MGAEEGETLVGSGAFKIDRARALEKLMLFALPDPTLGALLLVRCAVASGASYVHVEREAGAALTVRFDGEPLSAGELAAPYEALFNARSEKTARGRELAVGLLTMLRLEPNRILVRSGAGESRAVLRLALNVPETVTPAPDGGSETTVRFYNGPRTPLTVWGDAFAAALRRSTRMLPCPAYLDGERLPSGLPAEWGGEGREVVGEGLSGWVSVPGRCEPQSVLEVYRLGVRVEEVRVQLAGPPVVGQLNDDGLRLNASQSAVVRDDRFKSALEAAGKAARELIAAAALEQGRRAPQTARLVLEPGLRAAWARAVEAWASNPKPGLLNALGWLLSGEEALNRDLLAGLKADARRTLWLRDAARRREPEARAAREAPLYFGIDLAPLSPAALDETAGALGYLPVTERCEPDASAPFRILWLAAPAERAALARWFPAVPAADAGEALDRERRQALAGAQREVTLERVGAVELLARRPLPAPWRGELGLPKHLPDNSRLHVFVEGAPRQHFAFEGGLRLVAAVEAAAPVTTEQARALAAGVLESVPDLYAAAAAEFTPGDASPDAAALRAHLLDALAWWTGRAGGDKLPPWLRSLGIFSCEAGVADYAGLKAWLADGETLFFARQPPRQFAPARLFAEDRFDAAFLKKLFPDASAAAVPGRPELTAVWRAAEASEGLPLLEQTLRRRGTLVDAPADPERARVLEAVRRWFCPWMGAPGTLPRWSRVREHLASLPLFRRGDGAEGWTPVQLDARFASERGLAYGPAPGPGVDAVLDAAELGLADALWPAAQRRIVPAAAPAAPPAAAEPALPDAAPGGPSLSGMLVARQVEADGLRALAGLPPEPLPLLTVSVTGYRELHDMVLPTPGLNAAGRMVLDVTGWAGPVLRDNALHPALAKAARALYHRFLYQLLDEWPALSVGPAADGLRTYFLLFAGPAKAADDGSWASLRQRLQGAPLFATLGGGSVSLETLRANAAGEGRVYCAAAPDPAAPAADSAVPVIATPRLAAAALGMPVVPRRPAAAAPAAIGDPLRDGLEALLAAVRGRRGLDPACLPPPGGIDLRPGAQGALLLHEGSSWVLNLEHPAALLLLRAGLDPATRSCYLLSALSTAANRDSQRMTDAQDALLQALLADALAAGAGP